MLYFYHKKGGNKLQYNYKKLRGRIVEKYGSQKKFADILGVSENSVSKKMQGKTGFSQEDIVKWSQLLNIKKDEYTLYFFA